MADKTHANVILPHSPNIVTSSSSAHPVHWSQ